MQHHDEHFRLSSEKWLVGFLSIGRSYMRVVGFELRVRREIWKRNDSHFLVAVERRAANNYIKRTQRFHSVESIYCYYVFRCGICVVCASVCEARTRQPNQ